MKPILFGALLLSCLFSFSQTQSSNTFEPGQLFVRVADGKAEALLNTLEESDETRMSMGGRKVFSQLKKPFHIGPESLQNTLLIEVNSGLLDFARKTFAEMPFVELVERVPRYELFYTPNDPDLPQQWNLQTVQGENAWDLSTGSNAVTIAIVDDAVLLSHQDLAPNLWVNPGEIPGNNIDDDGNGYVDDINGYDVADGDNDPSPPGTATNSNFTHGTHVAGISGAATDNGMGIASIGFDIRLMAVKSKTSASSGGSLQAPYAGVQYAIAAGADVINMSWGGSASSATYQAIFDLAYQNGIVCIAAAGNSNTSAPMYPASYNNVISVGATEPGDAKASFSNFGATVDVMAPGDGIFSTLAGSNNSYGNLSGTSMASPLVAGLAGLMLSFDPTLSPDDLETCLLSTCDNIDVQNPNYLGQIGAGRINAYEALRCLKPIVALFTEDYTTICPGGQVQFTDQSTNSPTSWQWSFPGALTPTSTQQNPLVTYVNPGTYNVQLIATNPNGADTLLETAYINVALPAASLSGGATILAGFNATLQVNFSGNPPFDFSYSDGLNTVTETGITQNPYFFSVSPAVNSTYTLTAMNDVLCNGNFSGTATVNIIQNSGCNATASFVRTYGGVNDEKGWALNYTNDGGLIVGGSTTSFGAGQEDLLVMKLDACGYVEWKKTIGSTGQDYTVMGVWQTNDGGYVATGYYSFPGQSDYILVKFDAQGNITWSNLYGDAPAQYPRDLVLASDGGYLMCGVATSFSAGGNDISLIKTDASGTMQWARNYGQNANEFLHEAKAVPGGGYILSGYRRDYSSGQEMFLLRVDDLGNTIWWRDYDATATSNEYGLTVLPLSNGGFLAGGFTDASGAGGRDMSVLNLDANGNILWQYTYGSAQNEWVTEIVPLANGNFMLLGYTGLSVSRDWAAVEIDPMGNIVGQTALGGVGNDGSPSAAKNAAVNSFGNLAMIGWTTSYGAGGEDIYIVKTDISGIPACDLLPMNLTRQTSSLTTNLLTPTINNPPYNGVPVSPTVTDPNMLEGINCNSAAPTPYCLNVKGVQKISSTQGSFSGPLDNGDQFGMAISAVPDRNGDGVIDLAVAANLDDDGGANFGAFYFLNMNTDGTVQGQQKISATQGGFGGTLYAQGAMGSDIEPIGDFNNDNIDDYAIGVPRDNDGGIMKGAFFLLYMNSNGTVASEQKISETQGNLGFLLDAQDRFGQTITNLGDLNGDGVTDLAVGAPFDDDGGSDQGAVYILFMNSNGTVASSQKISDLSGGLAPNTLDPLDNFGVSIASLGDWDGNGTTDIVVGSRRDGDGGFEKGAVYILTLNTNGTVSNQYKISDTQGNFSGFLDNDDRFGISVDNLGDLNGDGVVDLVVGSYLDDDGGLNKGAAYVMFMNANATVQGAFKINDLTPGISGQLTTSGVFSWSAKAIGDLDNNGVVDLAIGEVQNDDGGTNRGAVWVVFLEDSCACQNGNMLTFQRTYEGANNEMGHTVITTSDGNLVVAGMTESSGAGQEDIFVMKTDLYGNPLWRKTYGGTGEESGYSVSIKEVGNDGFILVGHTTSYGSRDPLVIRLDPQGNIYWQKRITGGSPDEGRSVTLTSDGGFVIGGTSLSWSLSNSDAQAFKLDLNGNLVWAQSWGGLQQDHIIATQELPNGNLIYGLHTRSFGLGNEAAMLICSDPAGNLLWNQVYDGIQEDNFNSIDQTLDGGLIGLGFTESWGSGGRDLFLVKTDSLGNLEWSKTYGGPLNDRGNFVQQTSDGGYFLGGYTESFGSGSRDLLGIKIDAQGNVDWAKAYGGSGLDSPTSWGDMAIQATDGGYYLTGATQSFGGQADDVYLIKTDICGNSWCNEEDVSNQVVVTDVTPVVTSPTLQVSGGGAAVVCNLAEDPLSFADSILCSTDQPVPDSCTVMADFATDTTCLGDTTVFFDLSTDIDPIGYWEWDFGDGNGSLGIANPNHLYAATGSYTVTLIAGNICFDTVSYTVEVIDELGLEMPNDTTICAGDSVLLVPMVSGCASPPYTYVWTQAAGLSDPASESPMASPAVTTVYTLTVTASNGNIASGQVTVTVDQSCCVSHAGIQGDSLVCIGETANFSDNSLAQAGATYDWDFGPNAVPATFSGANPPLIEFSQLGLQTIQLILNDACGTDTAYFEVYVNPLPEANAGDDAVLCAGGSLMIGDSTVAYFDYNWSPTGGLSDPTISNPMATISSDMTYVLTVTDQVTGCSAMDTVNLLVDPPLSIDLPADTVLCMGETLTVVPTTVNVTNFQWQDNSGGPDFTVSNTGWVWVIGSNPCRADTDSMYVQFAPPPVAVLGGDVLACAGSSVVLTPFIQDATSVVWSDGSMGATLTVTIGGWYWVEASNDVCGSVRDSVFVEYLDPPVVELPSDTLGCIGSGLTLTANVTGSGSYQWQDGSGGSSHVANAAGIYWLAVSNVCGADTDSTTVEFAPIPSIDLGPDSLICEGDTLYLTPGGGFAVYQWQDGSSGTNFPAIQMGLYYVIVTDDNGCEATDQVQIWTDYCLQGLYIPNAFSPNGDDRNNEFTIVENGFTLTELNVFDRWGTFIFRSNSVQDAWDGTYKGQPVQEGVYIWTATYLDKHGKKGHLKGTVTVIR